MRVDHLTATGRCQLAQPPQRLAVGVRRCVDRGLANCWIAEKAERRQALLSREC